MIRFLFVSAQVLVIFALPLLAQTAEIPVNVKADKLKYIEESGLIEATGSAEVKLQGITIRADRILMDSTSNVATAEGHVILFAGNYQAASRRLTYDADKDVSRFSDFSAQFSPSKINGRLYVSARDATDDKKEMKGGPGTVTTCDDGPPHYFLSADKVNYYPEQRIEGWNDILYVGEAPVLWLPYFYYDLNTDRRRNWTFGHNEVEGNFIKTAWGISAGLLLLDYMDRKGLGYGLNSNFNSWLGGADYTLYHLDERDTGTSDWVEKITSRKQLDDKTTLELRQGYISTYQLPAGRLDQTTFGLTFDRTDTNRWKINLDGLDDRTANYAKYTLGLNQAAGRFSTSYNFNYDFSKTAPGWMHNSQRLDFQGPLADNINLNTSANYYRSTAFAGDAGEEKIEPTVQLTGSTPNFTWRYTQNWLIDFKKDLFPGNQHYQYLEKLPEVEISPKPLDLKFFNLDSTLGYGTYHEVRFAPQLGRNRDFAANRLRASLNATKSLPLKLGSTLTLGAGLDQFTYSPGDQLFALRENANLHTELAAFFRNDINFNQGYTEGNTPFLFDQLGTRYHEIREKMTFYYLNVFNWTVDGGHNWQTNKYYDVLSQLRFSPTQKISLNLNGGWDIENRLYKDLIAGLALLPSDYYSLNLSMTQDLNGVGLRAASAAHDLYLLKGAPNQIHLQVSQVFDAIAKDFKVREISLVKDLHCWEMRYNYSDYLKQFSLSFSLKALPGEPVSYSTGRGFYYQGIEKGLNELNPQTEIRRY